MTENRPRSNVPPRVLTIAGSDSGGGAGIQADLKTFAAHGVYGMSVVTAVTAQDTVGVRGIELMSTQIIAEQIDAVFDDIGVDVVKIGMLGAAAIIRTVTEGLARRPETPVVLDPVMVAKSGDTLLRDDAVAALRELLVPRALLVTPNLPECERLAGVAINRFDERRSAAEKLAELGPQVLLKGGHGTEEEIVDLLYDHSDFHVFKHSRQSTRSTHGTGCTLSSAIAARLARGEDLVKAVAGAIDYLQTAIATAYPLGAGHGPVNHLWERGGS